MAAANRSRARRRRRQGGAARSLPGWAMLTIGLIIGLFVAFLVYLDDLEAPPGATAEAPATDSSTPDGGSDDGGAEAEGPRFEFYSILPELEVVVPEFGSGASSRTREADGGDDGGDSTGAESADAPAPATPAPADGGRYFLQAGSFREAAQADRLKAEIALLGLEVAIQDVRIDGDQWHRVRVGPYQASAALETAQTRLRDNAIEYLVMREKSP